MTYTTQAVRTLFDVSHQTVKNWAAEFAAYLSPSATPGGKRQRFFTDDDLEVFALIAAMGKEGQRYDAIHLALASGQRGKVPERINSIAPSSTPAQVRVWQERVTQLQVQLRDVQAESDRRAGKVELLEKQLEAAQLEIRKLYQEIADYKAGNRSE